MKVAVIGVGRWGRNHARVLGELRKEGLCDKVVVCDTNRAVARNVASEFGLDAYYDDLRELISKERPEAAVIAVPTIYHYDVAMKLLPHADILIEKPIAAKLEEAEAIVRQAAASGRIVAVGHIERFNRGVIAVKDEVDRAVRGGDKVVFLGAQRIGPGPPRASSSNLGVAHDLLVHDIDVASYIIGSLPSEVEASIVEDGGVDVEIVSNFTFEEGVLSTLRASWRSYPKLKKRTLTVQTMNEIISMDYILQTYSIERGLIDNTSSGGYIGIVFSYQARELVERRILPYNLSEPLVEEDRNFLEAVRRGGRPLVGAREGYIALKCALYALKSAREGRRLKLAWDEDFI